MSKLIRLLMVVFALLPAGAIQGQNVTSISTPGLELQDDKLVVSYQILNSTDRENYRIWMEVTDAEDRKLSARSLTGDIGDHVPGGGTRYILWDYQADRVSLESGIYVQVLGEREIPPAVIEDPAVNNDQPVEEINLNRSSGKNLGGMLVRSAVFPGWGLSVARPGTLHWIKGVAGYGCLVSAFALNVMAKKDYNDYLDSNDVTSLNHAYDQAVLKDNLSEITAYAAISIWIIDMVWTAVAGPGSRQSGLRVGATLNPLSGIPMVALKLTLQP